MPQSWYVWSGGEPKPVRNNRTVDAVTSEEAVRYYVQQGSPLPGHNVYVKPAGTGTQDPEVFEFNVQVLVVKQSPLWYVSAPGYMASTMRADTSRDAALKFWESSAYRGDPGRISVSRKQFGDPDAEQFETSITRTVKPV